MADISVDPNTTEVNINVTSTASPSLSVSPEERVVTISVGTPEPQKVVQIVAGVAGPEGPRGAVGPTTEVVASFQATASEALGGHRVVQVYNGSARYASHTDLNLGMLAFTRDAVALGIEGTFYTSGLIIEPTWSFTEGPVYLALNGLLTQSKPSTGTVVLVGRAMSSTSLFLQFQQLYRRV